MIMDTLYLYGVLGLACCIIFMYKTMMHSAVRRYFRGNPFQFITTVVFMGVLFGTFWFISVFLIGEYEDHLHRTVKSLEDEGK